MGKGICADCYVGDRQAQEQFHLFYGGGKERPWQIQQRLERQAQSRKNTRNRGGRK